MKSLAEMKAELSTERQAWIEDRASELIAEEHALKTLRARQSL